MARVQIEVNQPQLRDKKPAQRRCPKVGSQPATEAHRNLQTGDWEEVNLSRPHRQLTVLIPHSPSRPSCTPHTTQLICTSFQPNIDIMSQRFLWFVAFGIGVAAADRLGLIAYLQNQLSPTLVGLEITFQDAAGRRLKISYDQVRNSQVDAAEVSPLAQVDVKALIDQALKGAKDKGLLNARETWTIKQGRPGAEAEAEVEEEAENDQGEAGGPEE
ncbi:hypothetical protein NM208_g4334 [Fusarium decemcellulare]|uniref:Uncharacterized protein n=1 Tax=Fusarium decemcellulare TaxID=57161 RepID=A0ACC1SL58_9HYPO|nr:hypothetical protein NM208_g4334 [Fusarium decemcellulare]